MASPTYSPDPEQFVRFYSPQPVTSAQGSHPESSRSPWSASSTDSFSLALPSLAPGDLADEPSLYDRLQSPSDFLPTQATASTSQPRHQPSPSTPQQLQQNFELYEEFESPDIFLNFDDHSPPRSPRSAITRTSSVVDLTISSPVEMVPPPRKRKPSIAENETAFKRARIFSNTKTTPSDPQASNVEVLDMVDVDDDQKYDDFKSKQQEELLKQQNQEKADKPLKLSEFQCIICLDNPTDLTVTHCGLFIRPESKPPKLTTHRTSLLLSMSP
jgi:hypothetical protein